MARKIYLLSYLLAYYWSGTSNDAHLRGVAIAISCKLSPAIVKATVVNERIMRLRLKQPLVAVYTPTKICETDEEMFYAKL